jgi:hypothetical protein
MISLPSRTALKAALPAAVVAALAVAVGGAAAAPSAYETGVLADNPLVYYRMADTELSAGIDTLRDSSRRGKHGAYSMAGGITQQGQPSPIAGDAADFFVSSDGRDRVATVSNPELPAGDVARTVEAWYKSPPPPFTPARQALVSWGACCNDRESFGMHVEENKLWVDVYAGQGYFLAPKSIQDGEWHHLAITYNPFGSPKYWGYVDGTQLPLALPTVSPIATGVALATNGAASLLLGAWTAGGFNLSGWLDEVAVYGTALSADEIKAHFDGATGTGCAGATGGEGQAASCVDVSVDSAITVTAPPQITFGNNGRVTPGSEYLALAPVTVETNVAGYQLSVSRTAFTPADQLKLSIRAATGAQPAGLAWDLSDTEASEIKASDVTTWLTAIGRRTQARDVGTDEWPTALVLDVPSGTPSGQYSSVLTFRAVLLP